MKAHLELGHAEKLRLASRLQVLSPHIPEKYAAIDRAAMEADATRRAEEIYRATGCAEAACESFDQALDALKALLASAAEPIAP